MRDGPVTQKTYGSERNFDEQNTQTHIYQCVFRSIGWNNHDFSFENEPRRLSSVFVYGSA